MSVLDYSVSRDGYLVSDHVSELTESALQETINEMEKSFGVEIHWREKIGKLSQEIYNLRHNTDMRPDTIDVFEVLNSKIAHLANVIADSSAKDSAVWDAMHSAIQKSIKRFVEPYLMQLMANKKRVDNKMHQDGYSYEELAPTIFVDRYRVPYMIKTIQSQIDSGLTNKIIDIPELCSVRDEYALENLCEYESFESVLNQILSGDSLFTSVYVGYECNRLIMDAKEPSYSSVDFYDRNAEHCSFGPYKAIARASMDNLDDIYNSQSIPESAYERLSAMACTLVNLFNVYWITSYISLASIASDIKAKQYAEYVIDTLKSILHPAASVPTSEPQPVNGNAGETEPYMAE